MFCYKYLPLFALLIQNIACVDFKCGPKVDNTKCKCYTPTSVIAETSQVVCTGAITPQQLKDIGNDISGEVNLLYIHHTTTLTDILAGTFNAATFKKIFIENNDELKTINAAAFIKSERTVTLVIRNNKVLVRSGLFETAALVEKILTDVEFQGNSIASFDSAFFKDGIFQNLAYIRLDGQVSVPKITLAKQSFGMLPMLSSLSLNNLKVEIADASGVVIDLSATKTQRVSIFLQDSQVVSVDGLLAANLNNKDVGLDLEKNLLTAIPTVCAVIAESTKGTCYLAENTQLYTPSTSCTCDAKIERISKILNTPAQVAHIWGVSGVSDLKCAETKIADCKVSV